MKMQCSLSEKIIFGAVGGNLQASVSKLEINRLQSTDDVINSTCLYVTVDLNGQAEPNSMCADNEHIPSLTCDRINFFVTDSSSASGNPNYVIGSKLINDNFEEDDNNADSEE